MKPDPGQASDARVASPAAALATRGVTKRFGNVVALDDVTVELHRGRVHAVVGENGAGKSTLTAVLGGVLRPDRGHVEADGSPVRFSSPAEALEVGIGVVYQELSLLDDLTVADNITLGVQPRRGPLIDRGAQTRLATELLDRLGGDDIDPRRAVRDLSVAKQQMVEIAKVLAREPSVVLFDEPTAMLPADDAANLLELIRGLADDGVAIGYISHRLAELPGFADEVTVLRDGLHVWTRPMVDVDLDEVVSAMVGRPVEEAFPERETTAEATQMLVVDSVPLPGSEVDGGVSFECRRGEILGVAGLVGSGRSRLARYLVGLESTPGGRVLLDDEPYHPRSPRRAVRSGIMLVPEDRKDLGLILALSLRRNVGLASLDRLTRFGVVDAASELSLAERAVDELDIRTPSVETPASSLSGGNQQKVVLGKWLVREPKLLILDEPLRGIDVNAKAEIHRVLRGLADSGLSIVLISSELPEVLGLSDRVMVMRDGRVAAIFEDKPFVPDEIMTMATMETVP